ncbi:MAG: alpha/beta fold hydrolase [Rhizobiaceae bacterium]
MASVQLAGAYAASVRTVTIGHGHLQIVGTLTLPAGDPAPVVLMLHGFAGARDELRTSYVEEGVFTRTANRLAAAGYASLRIDFRGSGDSVADLTFSQTTFESQILDARAAIEYLKDSPLVQGNKINLLGWDQGGLVASAVAGRTGLPNSVALWSAIVDTVDTFAEILGEKALVDGTQAKADQPVKATLPWGVEIDLNGGFFHQVERFNTAAEIASYSGPLFVAQGAKDELVSPESAAILIVAHDGPEKPWIYEMDHVFNVFDTDTTLESLISATFEFLNEYNAVNLNDG